MTRIRYVLMALTLASGCVAPAWAQEKVGVRTGSHDDYQRIVFEWPAPADYTLTRDGATLTLTFNKAGSADTRAIAALDNIAQVKEPAAQTAPLQIVMTIATDSRVRDLTIGNRIILDIFDPPAGRVKTVMPEPAPEKKPAEQAPEPQAAKQAEPDQPPPEQIAAEPPAATPGPAPASAPAPEKQGVQPHVITMSATKQFGMGVFERDGWLWLVADTDAATAPVIAGPDVDSFGQIRRVPLSDGVAYRVTKPDGIGVAVEGGGLRWRIVLSANPREIMALASQRLSPVPADAQTKALRQGASLRWEFGNARTILPVKDPEIGDTIVVATAADGARSSPRAYDFVELDSLPSYAGLAYVPLADDLRADVIGGHVRVGRGERDLSLSFDAPQESAAHTVSNLDDSDGAPPPVNASSLYQPARWQMGGLRARHGNQNVLMSGLGAKEGDDKVEDLLTLAKLNFATRRGAEALGYLRMAVQEMPEIAENAEFIGLRGASELIAGQYDLAVEDMVNPLLDDYPDVAYWRMATFAGLEDWQQAIKNMPSGTQGIADYADSLKHPMMIALAEVMLRGGEMMGAERVLAELEPAAGSLPPADRAAWTYLMGEAARQFKQYEKAKGYWTELARSGDDYHRARAGLALTRLLLERNEITPAQAIDRLETLRYGWRGDELETLVNYRLGQVYVENDDYLKGLHVLRNAASLSPASDLSREITDYMAQSFRTLFDSDELQTLSPLESIGVYEEFKELMPAGAEGDRLTEQLAERMVDADLLARAEGLLDAQVTQRLKGAEAGRVALRLAAIRLMHNKPAEALAALDQAQAAYLSTPEQTIPADKAREIALLRASALSRSGKAEEAIARLGDLPQDRTVARLRADIAWKNQRWEDAAEALDILVDAEQLSPDRPLGEEQADLILNRAIALNLAGDRVGMATVRDRFGARMANTAKAELFDVVTLPRRFGLIRSRDTIAESINNVDLFKDFLDSYRAENTGGGAAEEQTPAPAPVATPSGSTAE